MDLDDVKNISVYGANCVVDISRGNDDTCRFVSAKEKNFRVEAVDGQLTVTQKSGNLLSRIIMRRIEFKLILPRSFNGRLRLRNKNGGLYLKGGNFADVDVSTKNGKFDVEDVACAEFALKMRNGSIFIKNMKAARDVTLKCSNGNIKAESVAAQELTISCHNAGLSAVDIKTDKFDCSTHNGTIDASALDTSDIRLETSNGKITAMALGKRDDYRLTLETANGIIAVDGTPSKNISDVAAAKKRLNARTSNGDIDIRFV